MSRSHPPSTSPAGRRRRRRRIENLHRKRRKIDLSRSDVHIHIPSPTPSRACLSILSLEQKLFLARIRSAISIFISSFACASSLVRVSTCSSEPRDTVQARSASPQLRHLRERSLLRLRRFRYSSKLSELRACSQSDGEKREGVVRDLLHPLSMTPTSMPASLRWWRARGAAAERAFP